MKKMPDVGKYVMIPSWQDWDTKVAALVIEQLSTQFVAEEVSDGYRWVVPVDADWEYMQ